MCLNSYVSVLSVDSTIREISGFFPKGSNRIHGLTKRTRRRYEQRKNLLWANRVIMVGTKDSDLPSSTWVGLKVEIWKVSKWDALPTSLCKNLAISWELSKHLRRKLICYLFPNLLWSFSIRFNEKKNRPFHDSASNSDPSGFVGK